MLPMVIPHFGIGPFFGFATNVVMAILCLAAGAAFRHYRPLVWLFAFYLCGSLFFFGWFVQGLQQSTASILWSYKISHAGLAMLPACWYLFMKSLFGEKPGRAGVLVVTISAVLAIAALLGDHPWLYGLPLKVHPLYPDVLRPQSKVLNPLIYGYCLLACSIYFAMVVQRLWQQRSRASVYLWLCGCGLLLWLLGGVHDALLSFGAVMLTEDKILWFASFWLSVFLSAAVAMHFRMVEQVASRELECLHKAKDRALHHLAHELGTPLAIMRGNIKLMQRWLVRQASDIQSQRFFECLERQIRRLIEIQQKAEDIVRACDAPRQEPASSDCKPLRLHPLVSGLLRDVKQQASHRQVALTVEGDCDAMLAIDAEVVKDVLEGMLRNAIENTPDGGWVQVAVETNGNCLQTKIRDTGVGITPENLSRIFDGFYPTQDLRVYTSEKPFVFGAGGKGLDLLRFKLYAQRLGFDISAQSRRCVHLATDNEQCPGRISACPHCRTVQDCHASGGSTFCISWPVVFQLKPHPTSVPSGVCLEKA